MTENETARPNENAAQSFEQMMETEIYQNFLQCNYSVLHKSYPHDGDLYCNATFDGYTCWDYAKAGSKTFGQCPVFMVFQFGHQLGLPFKDCNTDGTWYRHPETNLPWTDYSPCSHTDKVQRAKNVLYVYFIGYGLSIVAMIMALLIFSCFRKLKCTRITIHKHLFLSYTLAAILWISYYATSAFDPHILQENPVWCRLLHVLAQYVTVCNYAWMFCEGFFLHTLLILAFTNERNLLAICYFIGWGVPVIPSIIYSILRSTSGDGDTRCWHDDTFLIWIFSGPIALSLFINVIFLVNILRIVCSKVRSIQQGASNPIRQSIRATCILIPLLGIQYFALPFRPNAGDEQGQYVYDMVSASLSSFQGLLVALLFCFFNGEVLTLLRSQIAKVGHLNRTDTARGFVYSAVQISDDRRTGKDVLNITEQMNDQQVKDLSTTV